MLAFVGALRQILTGAALRARMVPHLHVSTFEAFRDGRQVHSIVWEIGARYLLASRQRDQKTQSDVMSHTNVIPPR